MNIDNNLRQLLENENKNTSRGNPLSLPEARQTAWA